MIQELSATGSEQGEKRDGEDQKADASYVDEEEHDFPEGHENHITLGALKQDSSADGQDNQSIYEPRRRSKRKPSGRDQTPGRVIYVKNLPRGFYTDNDFLKIVKGFGRVHRYYLHGNGEEGFIEMERSSDATKALRELRYDGCKLYGQRVTILRSQKYKRLITGWKPESDSDSESDQKKDHRNSRSSSRIRRWISSHSKSAAKDKETKEEDEETKEEDKETKEEDEETKEEDEETKEEDEETKEEDEETKEEDEETKGGETKRGGRGDKRGGRRDERGGRGDGTTNQNNAPVSAAEDEKRACSTEDNVETKMEDNVERGPDYVKTGMESSFQPNNPVGREFITPVMGYFCNLCQVVYVNEDEAKNQHCSSLCHYLKFMHISPIPNGDSQTDTSHRASQIDTSHRASQPDRHHSSGQTDRHLSSVRHTTKMESKGV
ncbi:matrin-3-like [Oncorhynchus nerka]|uniref:matrin-3-like n=1 Tax=Oncorhynchus nerka TaxID=8023 RepID=UPI0031B86C5A